MLIKCDERRKPVSFINRTKRLNTHPPNPVIHGKYVRRKKLWQFLPLILILTSTIPATDCDLTGTIPATDCDFWLGQFLRLILILTGTIPATNCDFWLGLFLPLIVALTGTISATDCDFTGTIPATDCDFDWASSYHWLWFWLGQFLPLFVILPGIIPTTDCDFDWDNSCRVTLDSSVSS